MIHSLTSPTARRAGSLALWTAAFVLLTANFRSDCFRTVPKDRFENFQADSQALVDQKVMEVSSRGNLDIKRGFLVKSKEMERARIDSVFPAVMPADGEIYRSQFGLQGLMVSLLQWIFRLPATATLEIAETLMAAATAAVVIWLAIGLASHAGPGAAMVAVFLLGFSPPLVSGARNLYWAVPLMVLPLVATWSLYRMREFDALTLRRAVIVVGALVFLKCLCGYEYLSTLTLTPAVALTVVWASRGFANPRGFILHSATLFFVACVAFVCAAAVHFLFILWAVGSFDVAVASIAERAASHISGANATDAPLKYQHGIAGMVLMIIKYLTFDAFFVGARVNVGEGSYGLISISFVGVLVTAVLVALGASSHGVRRSVGMVAVVLAALIASVSWIIAARGHALHHFHVDSLAFLPLVFALPLALFGTGAAQSGGKVADAR